MRTTHNNHIFDLVAASVKEVGEGVHLVIGRG
jgi:hypothetical protein